MGQFDVNQITTHPKKIKTMCINTGIYWSLIRSINKKYMLKLIIHESLSTIPYVVHNWRLFSWSMGSFCPLLLLIWLFGLFEVQNSHCDAPWLEYFAWYIVCNT